MQMIFAIKPHLSGKGLVVCALLHCLVIPVAAGQAVGPADNTFYNKTRQGWFWYENPPAAKEKQDDKPDQTPHSMVSLNAFSIEDLWNMHPDDFQNLLNGLQKQAVQFPSEQNVLEYLTIQDIARRKALAYTHTASYVTQKYSNLFRLNQVYPTAGPGVTARVQMQQGEIAETLASGKADHALLFFVNPHCSFCEKQRQILSYFIEKYGWPIRTVDISKETDGAARFNIIVTPTLLLIKRGHTESMPVATGVITLSELERKLYRAIRFLQGKTDSDNFMLYDFQENSALDPGSILGGDSQPWNRAQLGDAWE